MNKFIIYEYDNTKNIYNLEEIKEIFNKEITNYEKTKNGFECWLSDMIRYNLIIEIGC